MVAIVGEKGDVFESLDTQPRIFATLTVGLEARTLLLTSLTWNAWGAKVPEALTTATYP
jgi:hypothetical protein